MEHMHHSYDVACGTSRGHPPGTRFARPGPRQPARERPYPIGRIQWPE